jgi:DNA polymerase III subunit delta
MKLTPDSLSTHLGQSLAPAYLVSGDEPLLTGEAADAIRAKARAQGFTEREVHFIERAGDWNDVRASAGTLSLFGSRRVVEIRLPTGKPGATGNTTLVELLEARDPDMVFLILTPRLDRDAQSAGWVAAVDKHGAWVPVWPVEAGRLVGWLRNRCRRIKLEATDEALELLAERTEGNLLAASQELEKLKLIAQGRAGVETVLESVADSARFDVFQLGEAVVGGDMPRALRILAGLRAEGVEATLVLWSLTKAMRDLWGTLATAGAPKARAWQRSQAAALDQGARRAPRLPFGSLAVRAGRADRMVKGRLAGDAWDEMALLAADICGHPPFPAPQSMLK